MGLVQTEYGLCYTADTGFYQYSDFDDCGLYIGDTGTLLSCWRNTKRKKERVNAQKLQSSMRTFWSIWTNYIGVYATKHIHPESIG